MVNYDLIFIFTSSFYLTKIYFFFQALGGSVDQGDSIPWSSRRLARGDPSGDGDSNNLLTSSSTFVSEVTGKVDRLVS